MSFRDLKPAVPSGKEIYEFDTGVTCNFIQNYGDYWLVLVEKNDDFWIYDLLILFIDFKLSKFRVFSVETKNSGTVDGVVFNQKISANLLSKCAEKAKDSLIV